jgi:hypothetical protein
MLRPIECEKNFLNNKAIGRIGNKFLKSLYQAKVHPVITIAAFNCPFVVCQEGEFTGNVPLQIELPYVLGY